jgi:DNA mismatch repair protein MutS2
VRDRRLAFQSFDSIALVDMNSKHLQTIEFPKILERLARHASFSASKELALSLTPVPYLSEARERQAETSEARRLLSVKPDVSVGGARDVRPLLEQAVRAARLLPTELLDIRQTLIAGRDLKRAIIRLGEQFPRLADIAARIEECSNLADEIARCISDKGDVLDSASPKLSRIRSELEIVHQRLLDRLNKIVQSPQNSPYLQETFVTQRQGRYVIPLRAEFKGRIRGVVHDQSASGATLFIEPLATVELNNRWLELQLEEKEEVRRILQALTDFVAQEAKYVRVTVEGLAELDVCFARAKYADELHAVEPEWAVTDDKSARGAAQIGPSRVPIKLVSARHPLLHPDKVVPIDVIVPAETFILVITGPNTGGKTVTLKTIALLVAMAQAGLHIPAAEGAKLPVFRSIYADIGDEQSIEQSLSTFSSHMTNIVAILDECEDQSLVVLDELGAGTDPVEGSALARAILEYLRARHVTTFVATHYSELKAYAHTTPGVTNASVEFDVETLAPTFHLRVGLPGRSNAFAIARRLGLDEEIVRQGEAMVTPEAMETEAMLQDIQAQLDAAVEERAAAQAERAQVEARLRELSQRLADIDAERRDILNSARADARREIKAVRQELRRLREEWTMAVQAGQAAVGEQSPPMQELERETQSVLDELESAASVREEPPAPEPKYRGLLEAGDQVWVQPYQAVGEVISSQRGEVEVQLGSFRATVKRNQVELRGRSEDTEAPAGESETGGVRIPSGESPGMELDLRGQTTEEALHRLELYLNDAYMAGLPWVRIIHGKGTGALRAAVRDELKTHPLVSSFEAGQAGEGGAGVTVAKLVAAD